MLLAGNGKEDAFFLVTQIVAKIFTLALGKARVGMATSINTLNPKEMALSMIWGTLRTMAVVEEFMVANIADHPSVTASYVRYAVQNSAAGRAKTLQTEVAELKKELTATKRVADQATSQLSALKNEFNQLKESVKKNANKKVKFQENKE